MSSIALFLGLVLVAAFVGWLWVDLLELRDRVAALEGADPPGPDAEDGLPRVSSESTPPPARMARYTDDEDESLVN